MTAAGKIIAILTDYKILTSQEKRDKSIIWVLFPSRTSPYKFLAGSFLVCMTCKMCTVATTGTLFCIGMHRNQIYHIDDAVKVYDGSAAFSSMMIKQAIMTF